jgi:HEPN domain-containing protein
MIDDAKNWWEQAKADLDAAKNNFKNGDYYVSAFLCHQAVEKGLKALHIRKYNSFPRVHDLIFLSRKLDTPEEIIDKCDKLTWMYIDTRYPDVAGPPPFKKFNKSNTMEFIELAEEVLEWIENQV